MAKQLDGKTVAEEYDEHGVVMPDDEVEQTSTRETAALLAGFYNKGTRKRRVYVTDWEDDSEGD